MNHVLLERISPFFSSCKKKRVIEVSNGENRVTPFHPLLFETRSNRTFTNLLILSLSLSLSLLLFTSTIFSGTLVARDSQGNFPQAIIEELIEIVVYVISTYYRHVLRLEPRLPLRHVTTEFAGVSCS